MSELMYDKLTGLMTPFHFYESAKRVKSWANRKGQALALIAIRLPEISDDVLVDCARKLNSELRGGDLLARMGERTFVLLLLGDEEGAGHLIFRLANTIKPKLDFSSTFFSENETLVEALNRLCV
ncbi:MAG: diguanylate cyclase domain-containing protein [Actinomycetota bacterium]